MGACRSGRQVHSGGGGGGRLSLFVKGRHAEVDARLARPQRGWPRQTTSSAITPFPDCCLGWPSCVPTTCWLSGSWATRAVATKQASSRVDPPQPQHTAGTHLVNLPLFAPEMICGQGARTGNGADGYQPGYGQALAGGQQAGRWSAGGGRMGRSSLGPIMRCRQATRGELSPAAAVETVGPTRSLSVLSVTTSPHRGPPATPATPTPSPSTGHWPPFQAGRAHAPGLPQCW